MIRKLVFTLVVAALLLSSPVALVAQNGPAPSTVSVAIDGGGGMHHVVARHGSDADPNGQPVEVAGHPILDLFGWFEVFLASIFSS